MSWSYATTRLAPRSASMIITSCFVFSSRRRHTRLQGDWSSDVCSSDLEWPVDRLMERSILCRVEPPQQKGYEGITQPALWGLFLVFLGISMLTGRFPRYGEIGRASCRERV